MQKIILLAGDSGSGKDFLLRAVSRRFENVEVIKKCLSRAPRIGEEDSISAYFSIPADSIKKMDYCYEGLEQGNWYGFKKEDIIKALENNRLPIVICPSYEILVKMRNDFPNQVVPFFVYRGFEVLSEGVWQETLVARGSSQTEIENRRINRNKYFKELYIKHFEDYGANVILNHYGIISEEEVLIQFHGLCKKNGIDLVENKMGISLLLKDNN